MIWIPFEFARSSTAFESDFSSSSQTPLAWAFHHSHRPNHLRWAFDWKSWRKWSSPPRSDIFQSVWSSSIGSAAHSSTVFESKVWPISNSEPPQATKHLRSHRPNRLRWAFDSMIGGIWTKPPNRQSALHRCHCPNHLR